MTDIVTFGCRLNTYESEVIRRHAEAAAIPDLVVVNTCAVTAEAVRQARQAIRKLKRERPDARIVVTGCAAQTTPEIFAEMPEVARVLGNEEKESPILWRSSADLLQKHPFGLPPEEKAVVGDIMAVKETALHLIDGFEGRARAFVQVQNGCDHRCTFCIIPYGRGNSRSVPMGEVVAQVRRLVERGYAEVVLTGVDLTSYGQNLPGAPKLGFLVKQILKHVPELPRLRLSSIDSVEADRDLLDAFASEERLMPHLHLSLQAGDDLILKRMKRRHLSADAIRFCADMRKLRPDTVFGGDIIAGFPTETEEMFKNSLDLVDECGLTHLHVFPFSPRPGTPAAKMPQVRRDVVKERARRLREKGAEALVRHLDGEMGKVRQVLVESRIAADAGGAVEPRGSSPLPACGERVARSDAARRVRGNEDIESALRPLPNPPPQGGRERTAFAARPADSTPAAFALGRTEHFTEVILDGPAEPGAIVAATIAGHDGRRLRADLCGRRPL